MQTSRQAIQSMPILVIAADDSGAAICAKLRESGYNRVYSAASVEAALREHSAALVRREPLELSLLSLPLPGSSGADSFQPVRDVSAAGLILLAGGEESSLAQARVGHGADDLMLRPLNLELLLLKVEKVLTHRHLQKELRNSTARNETLFLNVLAVMAKVLEAKDSYTRFHSEKVSSLAVLIARELGMRDDEVRRVGVAGMLHDIGKMGISESILKKPGPLDSAEREIVERHSIIASTILEPIEQLRSAVTFVKHHHERFDGHGYPEGLAGPQIPLGARIVHVAEAFDAMVSKRSYNTPRTPAEAMAELQRHAGTQFDPQVVEACLNVLRRHETHPEIPFKSLPALLEDLSGAS